MLNLVLTNKMVSPGSNSNVQNIRFNDFREKKQLSKVKCNGSIDSFSFSCSLKCPFLRDTFCVHTPQSGLPTLDSSLEAITHMSSLSQASLLSSNLI